MAALYCLNQEYHQYQIGVNINDSAATAQIVVEISCKIYSIINSCISLCNIS
jgi:hypothetical protein